MGYGTLNTRKLLQFCIRMRCIFRVSRGQTKHAPWTQPQGAAEDVVKNNFFQFYEVLSLNKFFLGMGGRLSLAHACQFNNDNSF